MRQLITLLFLLGFVQISLAQSDLSTFIQLPKSEMKVGELLQIITAQTNIYFSYASTLIDKEERVQLSRKEADLNTILEEISTQLDLKYELVEGQIVFTAAPKKQQIFTYSGYVTDGESGEVLIGASVVLEDENRGATTNVFGYFVMNLTEGEHDIQVSYLGYEVKNLSITLDRNRRQTISLNPQSISLSPVIVGIAPKQQLSDNQLDRLSFSPDVLKNLPEFGGESSLVKGLQSLPSVSLHSDGAAFFNVRGGARDQNLILIDDAPIFGASHLFGFYSMVVPDFTKRVKVYTNDMPTTVGDRLSSVIDIRTNDGNLKQWQLHGALNPLVNRFTLEVPIVKNKSALFVSYRRSNFNPLLQRANNDVSYHFDDFHLKWNYKLNDRNRLFLTLIQISDFFRADGTDAPINSINWGNGAMSLRWNHLFGSRLFANTSLYGSFYGYNVEFGNNFWTSEIGVIGLKSQFTHYASSKYTAKFGLDLQVYASTPGGLTLDSTIALLPNLSDYSSQKNAFFYEGEYTFDNKWSLKSGLRLTTWRNVGPRTYFTYDDEYQLQDTVRASFGVYNFYRNFDPRLSVQYQMNDRSLWTLSYGSYRQYLQLILNSISPFSTLEVWLASSPHIQPQVARHLSLNFSQAHPKKQLNYSLAAYYKQAQHQIDYRSHATTLLNPFLEGELRFGESRAWGVEGMLKKRLPKSDLQLSCTFAQVRRRTDDLNNGEVYRAIQDRPYELSIIFNHRWSPRWQLSTYWTSFSGATFSSPVGFYRFNEQQIPVYGERNNDRLPAYHRLDMAIQFQLNKRQNTRYRHHLKFSIYNALAHQNVYAVKFNKLDQNNISPRVPTNVFSEQALSPSEVDLIRFFPSLTYNFSLR